METDISSWPSITKLFKFTYEKYGRIEVVAANAGIHGHERWLEDIMDSNGELEKPDFPAINVNLVGMLYSISLPQERSSHYSIKIGSPLFRQEFHARRSFNHNWLCFLILRYSTPVNLRSLKTWCPRLCPKYQNHVSRMERPSQHDRPLDDRFPPLMISCFLYD